MPCGELLGVQRKVLTPAGLTCQKSSCLQQRRTRGFLWLHKQSRPVWVRPWLAPPDTQSQCGLMAQQRSSWFVVPGDELRSLCEQGQLDKALNVLFQMDQPTVDMYSSLLKACIKRKALAHAKRVHVHMAKNNLDTTTYLGEYLVSTLVRCCGLEDALQVFNRLPHRTVFSWTAVISGYTMSGQGRQALRMYHSMQDEGVQPSTYTFVSLLQACARIADLKEGKLIHAEALKHRFETDLIVLTCLVDMYAKCGSMADAQNVFDKFSVRDVVSWNAMLAAYARQGEPEKVLQLYGKMLVEGASTNERTFVSALQACGMLAEKDEYEHLDDESAKLTSLATGKAIHAEAWKKGHDSDVFVGNTLVSMYGKYGCILDARNVFDGLSMRSVASWNAMVTAYAQQNQSEEALKLYEQMREEAVSPNDRTFVSTFQACGNLAEKEHIANGLLAKPAALEKGKALHADAWKNKYDLYDAFVGSSLLSMYGKCGNIIEAEIVFDRLSHCDVVLWNAMLAAYVEQGQADKVLELYGRMHEEGISPDMRTFVSLLQGCDNLIEKEDHVLVHGQSTKVKSLGRSKAIHAAACKKGYVSNVFVGTSLISMYGKCGSIVEAHSVFDGLSHRTVVSWTALLGAYVEVGYGEKALQLYHQMQEEGVNPSEITLVCILYACCNAGGLVSLRHTHDILVSAGTYISPLVSKALIHAYGKCASMEDAQIVFDELTQPDVVAWTALIAGYARQGNYVKSLQCFEQMLLAGTQPDGVTFLSVLCACSHAGLVDEGIGYFESMSRDHGITPQIEHYVSIIDLLGRAGHFEMLEHLLLCLPIQPDLALWSSLLGACQKHSKVVLGQQAFDCAVRLEPQYAASYALMSNIYTDAGLEDRAKEVQELRWEKGAWKKPGQSWILDEKDVHTFMVGCCNHPQHDQLYNLLAELSPDVEMLQIV